jgi:hypothetical protein
MFHVFQNSLRGQSYKPFKAQRKRKIFLRPQCPMAPYIYFKKRGTLEQMLYIYIYLIKLLLLLVGFSNTYVRPNFAQNQFSVA